MTRDESAALSRVRVLQFCNVRNGADYLKNILFHVAEMKNFKFQNYTGCICLY
jgi:hypothetical protein